MTLTIRAMGTVKQERPGHMARTFEFVLTFGRVCFNMILSPNTKYRLLELLNGAAL